MRVGDKILVIDSAYSYLEDDIFFILWISYHFFHVGRTKDQWFADYYFGESQIRLL
jgi:hypothetical protein